MLSLVRNGLRSTAAADARGVIDPVDGKAAARAVNFAWARQQIFHSESASSPNS